MILGLTQVGWYAWGSALIADLLITLAGVPASLNWLLVVVATYLFCVTAYIGYGAMDWVSRFAVPAMIILMIWSLAITWGDVGGYVELQAINPAGEMGIGEALTVIVGTFVSGGTQVTNWSRFALSPAVGFWGTFLDLVLLGTFIPPIGGVIMADFWLHRRDGFDLDSKQPNFNWAGVTAYILASAIAYFTPGVKPINGIIAAALIYWLFGFVFKNNSQART